MKIEFTSRYHFFPVGQGLFSCGCLCRYTDAKPGSKFVWVYDCGTVSSHLLIKKAITDFEKCVGTSRQVDLLTLSHFDRDHISGVRDLLGRFRVGTLLLPFMHFAQRLTVAFEERIPPDDPLMPFFINPVTYLANIEGRGIDRILFVRASGDEAPLPPESFPSDEPPTGDDRLELMDRGNANISDPEGLELMKSHQGAGPEIQVEFLNPGGTLSVNRFWEFVPFNDDPNKMIPESFSAKVDAHREALLSANSPLIRKIILADLKEAYDQQFGNSSEDRNAISLFLYAGPIRPWPAALSWAETSRCHRFCLPQRRLFLKAEWKWSILYTGDGYLETNAKLGHLMKYLGTERVKRMGLFQVMHHGAEPNWHKGVSAAFSPVFSVFCSDPAHKRFGHPHAAVLRDFWPYGPIQVDKVHGFTLTAHPRWTSP